jgi:hypothetical protein
MLSIPNDLNQTKLNQFIGCPCSSAVGHPRHRPRQHDVTTNVLALERLEQDHMSQLTRARALRSSQRLGPVQWQHHKLRLEWLALRFRNYAGVEGLDGYAPAMPHDVRAHAT